MAPSPIASATSAEDQRNVCPRRGGGPAGGAAGPPCQTAAGERRGDVWKRRHEMDAAQDVDQDRRGRAAGAEHDDQTTQRIELTGQRTGEPDSRAEGKEQPGDQEPDRERKERKSGAEQRPDARPEQRSGEQPSRSRRKPKSHWLYQGLRDLQSL